MNVLMFVRMFLTTIGVITLIGIGLSRYVITGDIRASVQGFEYASPVFAFVGAVIALWIEAKSSAGVGKAEYLIYILSVGVAIIILYMMFSEYMPPSFAVLRWTRTPILP